MPRNTPFHRLIATALILVFGLVTLLPSHAQEQESGGIPVQFIGTVESVEGLTITIGGVEVDISNTTVAVNDLEVGVTVNVSGRLQEQTVVATTIIIITTAPPVETTPEVTPEPSTEVTPEVMPETTPEPTDEGNNTAPIIVIEGPVEEINVNYITIFDIDIQVESTDPVLTEIRIGDTVRVAGETHFDNNVIVIVAVNITIIDVDIFIVTDPGVPAPGGLPPNCKITKKGKIKCSKKKSSKKRS